MSSALNQLIDDSRVDQVNWDSIPAPPHARVRGNHLFVNVRYGDRFSDASVDEFVAAAEADATTIIDNAVRSGVANGNESICVSFFINGGQLSGRALRVSVMKSDFQKFVRSGERLRDGSAVVTSEVKAIEALLTH